MAKSLKERGIERIVVNCGERGYTFTQGVIRLLMMLQGGSRPTEVVFIDGFNDIFTAYYSGIPGRIGMHHELYALLEEKRLPFHKKMASLVWGSVKAHSGIYRGVERVANFLGAGSNRKAYSELELSELSLYCISNYIFSVKFVEMLSIQYGFTFRCFLQPILFTKDHWTEEERSSDPVLENPQVSELTKKFYAGVQSAHITRFTDLSGVFGATLHTVFVDACHVTEEGNERIAEAVSSVLF